MFITITATAPRAARSPATTAASARTATVSATSVRALASNLASSVTRTERVQTTTPSTNEPRHPEPESSGQRDDDLARGLVLLVLLDRQGRSQERVAEVDARTNRAV